MLLFFFVEFYKIFYFQANKESPFFATEYNSTEQAIDITFKAMIVSLHQVCLFRNFSNLNSMDMIFFSITRNEHD